MATGAWTNNCTTTSVPTFDEILATCQKFQAEQRRIDDGLIEALRKTFGTRPADITRLARKLLVSPQDVDDYLIGGKRPVSAQFWDAVRVMAETEPAAGWRGGPAAR